MAPFQVAFDLNPLCFLEGLFDFDNLPLAFPAVPMALYGGSARIQQTLNVGVDHDHPSTLVLEHPTDDVVVDSFVAKSITRHDEPVRFPQGQQILKSDVRKDAL